MSLYRMPKGLLMIDLDQPSYKICMAAASRVGLRPMYALSTSPLHIAPRAADVSAIIFDAENCGDAFKAFCRIDQLFPVTPFVVLIGREEHAQARLAKRLGARQALGKPCDGSAVECILRQLIEDREFHEFPISTTPRRSPAPDAQRVPNLCWRCGSEILDLDQNGPLAEVEKRAVLAAVRLADGDKLRAARMLGIGKSTLYRKLKEFQRLRTGRNRGCS